MKVTRWLMLGAVGLFGCIGAQADSSHFLINLGGWDANQDFNFIANPDVIPVSELQPCLPVGDFCGDPSIRINTGGGSIPIYSPDFTFNSNQVDGNGNVFFDNMSGTAFSSVEITTILTPDESNPNTQFECSGGDLFQSCGFVDPPTPNGEELDIYFYNPYGNGIISTPEPGQWIVLLIGCAAMFLIRARKVPVTSVGTER